VVNGRWKVAGGKWHVASGMWQKGGSRHAIIYTHSTHLAHSCTAVQKFVGQVPQRTQGVKAQVRDTLSYLCLPAMKL